MSLQSNIVLRSRNHCFNVRGGIQNIPDWCRHLYSSCGSAKHRSQQAKILIPGFTAKFCGDCVKTCEDPPSPELLLEQICLLHHDNAPSHTSVLTQQFLAK
jgi:hypothetical protein